MNLKELSDVLGLSPTTVSRALNGYPEVSEATRERVQRMAAQNQYRPSLRAMSLATGRAMAIGHVIPVSSKNDVVNPVFSEFIAGASQTYARQGYELILNIADQDEEADVYRSLAAKRAVDGVIVHSPKCVDTRVDLLREIGLPFIIHGRVEKTSSPYSWIDMNNRRAFKQATELLLDLGHRRIALINGNEALTFASLRRHGYEDALTARGVTIDPSLLSAADMTESYGFKSAQTMLAADDAPTAFLVSSYVVALGVRRAIGLAGLRMREDVSVIIHDDELSYFDNGGSVPQFTATRSSVKEAGIKGAQMLLDLIDDPAKAPVNELLEAQLVMGASTGPARN